MAAQSATLMESGSLPAHIISERATSASATNQTKIQRGMIVFSSEGSTAGRVAAVVVSSDQQKMTHVLLLREGQPLTYHLLPLDLIKQVGAAEIVLTIAQPRIAQLPQWHGAGC